MGIRDSFSRLKERLELGSTGGRRKPDGTESGTDREGVDRADSLPRPAPYVVVGGHNGGGSGSDAGGRQAHLMDFLPPLDKRGCGPGEPGGRADVDGGEIRQSNLHPRPDIEVVVGSGPGREGDGAGEEGDENFYSCSSAPSTPRDGEPDGE